VPTTKRRVGRPRADDRPDTGLSPREELLDAAAALFVSHGYAATSTRAIAERAGMRQASMYHYFAGKEDLLATLLEGTVAPSLELATGILGRSEPAAEARLWLLCRADTALLGAGRHNLGALYLLPEAGDARFASFHEQRARLKDAYRRLLAATAVGAGLDEAELTLRAHLVFGLVESVILARRESAAPGDAALPEAVADGALRLAGLSPRDAARAGAAGRKHLRSGAS
jgi:AcrR family transcriptional regulator